MWDENGLSSLCRLITDALMLQNSATYETDNVYMSRRRNSAMVKLNFPVTVAERSKTWTVFARADTGTVGSNTTQGMDV
jgi:hypothetical protein